MTVALSYVLGWITPMKLPMGGQVSLEMLPVLTLARLRGPGPGVAAGVVLGLLKVSQEPVVFNLPQGLLDFPLAFGLLGLAGLPRRGWPWDLAGVLLGAVARFLAHFASGVLFWELFLGGAAPPGGPFWYSLTYNASYMIPSTVMCLLLVPLLARRLRGAVS